jgi:hypothetical protein
MAIPGYSLLSTELTAITAANRDEGHFYSVRDKGGAIFWFDPASSATANGTTVLIPDDTPSTSPGRWLITSGGSGGGGGGSISIGTSKPTTTPTSVGEMVAVNDVTTPTALIGGITPVVVTVTRRSIWVATGTSSAADWKRFGPADIEVIVPTSYTGSVGSSDVSPDSIPITPEYLGQRCLVGHAQVGAPNYYTRYYQWMVGYDAFATNSTNLYAWINTTP